MVADYYYQLTTATVRRYDKEHLILGTRLHDWSKYNQKVVEACARYCDLVSVNYYARWQPEADFLANLKVWCGRNLFSFRILYKSGRCQLSGTGYANTEGGGWLVHTQKIEVSFIRTSVFVCLKLETV